MIISYKEYMILRKTVHRRLRHILVYEALTAGSQDFIKLVDYR